MTVTDMLNHNIKLSKKFSVKTIDLIFFIIITIISIFARFTLFPYKSADYNTFLLPWFNNLKNAGGLKGIGLSLGDYTPPYIYIMSLLTYLPINSLISIKLISCIFDIGCALLVMKMIYEKFHNKAYSLVAYTSFLFAPTVLLNSAMWAQCDVIYTMFLVLCVYYFTKNKPFLATLFFSVAFVFKLQAIFLAPLLLLMWLKNKIKFIHFFLIPLVYVISILPALIMGRPIFELLTIYISQSGQYKKLSLNAPTIYSWFSNDYSHMLGACGVLLCSAVVFAIIYILYKTNFQIDSKAIIAFAFLFSLIVPFLLPHMHERYFYVADIISIIYAFYNIKRFYIPICVILSSLLCYCPYLFGTTPVKIEHTAVIVLFVIYVVIFDIRKLVIKTSNTNLILNKL